MDSEGIRQLIVIPQTQYQQLIQNQKQAATTTPPKVKDQIQGKSDQNQLHGENTDAATTTGSEMDIIYGDTRDDGADDVEGKLLQIIQCSYPKNVMRKMRKLFLFIIHFGNDVLTFNRKGNVLIKGEETEQKSNILDLLEAAVTGRFSEEPVGYKAFLGALQEINVPSNFYVGCNKYGKWTKEKRSVNKWTPY